MSIEAYQKVTKTLNDLESSGDFDHSLSTSKIRVQTTSLLQGINAFRVVNPNLAVVVSVLDAIVSFASRDYGTAVLLTRGAGRYIMRVEGLTAPLDIVHSRSEMIANARRRSGVALEVFPQGKIKTNVYDGIPALKDDFTSLVGTTNKILEMLSQTENEKLGNELVDVAIREVALSGEFWS